MIEALGIIDWRKPSRLHLASIWSLFIRPTSRMPETPQPAATVISKAENGDDNAQERYYNIESCSGAETKPSSAEEIPLKINEYRKGSENALLITFHHRSHCDK